MTPDPPEPMSPVMRRGHEELHAAVTAYLGGDVINSAAVVALSNQPRALASAAVRELAQAIASIAERAGTDPRDLWRDICAEWTRAVDTDLTGG